MLKQIALAALACVSVACGVAGAQCQRRIDSPFAYNLPTDGADGPVRAVIVWDPDGPGPEPAHLIIGGRFDNVGGVPAQNIADWDGHAWHAMGAGLDPGIFLNDITVQSLAVWDPDGAGPLPPRLVAGGEFRTSGGVTVNNIAVWDGALWQPLGSGVNDTVLTMTTWDPQNTGHPFLVVGGQFTSAGGTPVSALATWSGLGWNDVGGGVASTGGSTIVDALIAWDPDGTGPAHTNLVVGGQFQHAGGIPANNIARYDGSAWNTFGTGCDGFVGGIVAWNPSGFPTAAPSNLVVIGGFIHAGGASIERIARWDGSWHSMGWDNGSGIFGITIWDPDGPGPQIPNIVICGDFLSAPSGLPANGVARWDGTNWFAPGGVQDAFGDLPDAACLTTWDPDGTGVEIPQLVLGGFFDQVGNLFANNVARYDGANWLRVGGQAQVDTVYAFNQVNNRLAIAGSFISQTATTDAYNVATWDGSQMLPLGQGLNGAVRALTSFTTGSFVNRFYNLVAGGDFSTAGGAVASHVAQWTESSLLVQAGWSAMGAGLNGTVNALERFNNATYAGGVFSASGATALGHIARWDTSTNPGTWQPLGAGAGQGVNGIVNALKTYGGFLYAGGSFTSAGGLTSGGLARWNGTAWSIVGGNFTGTVYSLEVFNNELVIGGQYPGIGGSPNIAKYNGTTYSTLGTGGTDGPVYALASAGGALYAGGNFATAGGVLTSTLARWNGSSWAAADGDDEVIHALRGYQNEVEVGAAARFDSGWSRYLATGVPWLTTNSGAQSATCSTGSVSFSVQAAQGFDDPTVPTPPGDAVYAWRLNGMALADGPTGFGSSVLGAHTSDLTILAPYATDAGAYDCVVSNSCGSATSFAATLTVSPCCGRADFNCDGDIGTDADIEAFFACLAGNCPPPPCTSSADFNGDGDIGTDADIEAFFRVLAGGSC